MVLVSIMILVVAIGSFVGYGLSKQPVVEFTFGGSSDVRQYYQLFAMSRAQPATIDITHILVRNTGAAAVTVVVTMHALNAVISTGYYGPYSDTANIELTLPPGLGNQVVPFYLTLPVQVTSFTLRVTIGRVVDFSSITSLATSTLASTQSTPPTTLVYSQLPANPVRYELIQQY